MDNPSVASANLKLLHEDLQRFNEYSWSTRCLSASVARNYQPVSATWHGTIAECLRNRALHYAMNGRVDVAQRMVEIARDEEFVQSLVDQTKRG